MSDIEEETLIEIAICPECFGTGFANHYLTDRSERECWKCKGQGEIAIDTGLIRALKEQQMSDWQPIETATKSEEIWLLGCVAGSKFPVPMSWDEADGVWFPINQCFKNWKPTHWMPLPEPPAALKEQKK